MTFQPNTAQLMSLLRTLLQIAGTALVSHGTLGITGAMWEQISGGILMVAPMVWSMFAHTEAAQVANVVAIAAQPDSPVKAVITTSDQAGKDLAASIPGPIESAGSSAAAELSTKGAAQ